MSNGPQLAYNLRRLPDPTFNSYMHAVLDINQGHVDQVNLLLEWWPEHGTKTVGWSWAHAFFSDKRAHELQAPSK